VDYERSEMLLSCRGEPGVPFPRVCLFRLSCGLGWDGLGSEKPV